MISKRFLQNKYLLTTLAIVALVAYSFVAFAAGPFAPGATLDPVADFPSDCTGPTDGDCYVTTGWQINTTDGFVYNNTDMVGIGTDTPSASLNVVGDVVFETEMDGSFISYIQGNLSVIGGDQGFFMYAGNASTITGLVGLDYNGGNPVFNVALIGDRNVSMTASSGDGSVGFNSDTFNVDSNSSMSFEVNDGVGPADGLVDVDYNSGDPFVHASVSGTENVSFGLNSLDGTISASALETFFGNSSGASSANLHLDGVEPEISLDASDADSGTTIFGRADRAGIIYNTLSSDNDGSGTPLVMSVFDENERGGGYSARSRNQTYDFAGADMYVWDPALGGDRTFIYITEEHILSGLMLDPTIPDAMNLTTNDINEISFEFHDNDPTIANNSLYTMNADFTWSKPLTLGNIMTLSGTTGALSITGNTTTDYVGKFFNDGNNANRYGIQIQAGADNGTGTTYYVNALDGDGTQVGYIARTAGTFALTDVSDRRTKTNIEDTSVDGLDVITNLRVVDFNRIQDPHGDTITGFIAQEVQDAYPEAVTEGQDGYLGIMKDALVPVLVKAVQELDVQLTSIETIATMQNETFVDSLRGWLADAGNGVTRIFTDRLDTKQLCVEDVCVTRDQFLHMVEQAGTSPEPAPAEDAVDTGAESSDLATPENGNDGSIESLPDPSPETDPEPLNNDESDSGITQTNDGSPDQSPS